MAGRFFDTSAAVQHYHNEVQLMNTKLSALQMLADTNE